ncbi:MAG: hypothetical protein ABJB74_17130 [Gemmatimonas sp.]
MTSLLSPDLTAPLALFRRALFLLAVLLSASVDRAVAQATTAPAGLARKPVHTRSWIALGPGAGGSQRAGGIGVAGEYVFQRDQHVFMFRAAGGFELDLAGDGGDSGIGDVGVLYGRAINGEVGHALVAGGVGALYGGCPDLRGKACKTIPSLPVTAEAAFHFGPIFGLGAQLFGNINSRDIMYGGVVMIQLGWFGKTASATTAPGRDGRIEVSVHERCAPGNGRSHKCGQQL